ncbi:MAG: bifunctional folylpolyglutamate synthase/dihydrofolate synthase [Saprospirales bacterium]|nr:MAG: bifunctional folylpolyglutamate synthase/dihydrofolate synthase [Saprospirales bacterium]
MNSNLSFRPSNYSEALDFLYSQLPMFQRVGPKAFKANLNNIRDLVDHLGNPEKKFRSIHIAGTNGKGSVSHIIAAILQAAGYKTGLYTSPHYKDFRERIKVNGTVVNQEFVIQFVHRISDLSLKLSPSFFEISVAMAFEYFKSEEVDVAVIETGLGGRLDSTNIIVPEISVITNIGMDHTQFLGNTLEAIAEEKAGIIKKGVPIVIGKTQSETRSVFQQKADSQSSPLTFADQRYRTKLTRKSMGCSVLDFFESDEKIYERLEVDLMGNYQEENLNTALATAMALKNRGFKISENAISRALSRLRQLTGFVGRMQILGTGPLILADSAHNREGIQMLIDEISTIEFDRLKIVIGLVGDKDPTPLLSLLPRDATYYFARANIPRGMDAGELKNLASKCGLSGGVYKGVEHAFIQAQNEAGPHDLVLVCGSIFTVAEVLPG